jgi:Lar family restriction alleviation protein
MDIKPCPFCGSSEVEVVQGETFRWRLAQCHQCGAKGPEVAVQTTSDSKCLRADTIEGWMLYAQKRALEDWNQRKGPPPLEAMVV